MQLETVSQPMPQRTSAISSPVDWQSVLNVVGAIILGLVVSGVAAFTAAQIGILFVIPMVLIVPLGVLLVRYPFAAIWIWLLVFPFVVRGSSPVGVPLYYMVHRLMIPGALWLVIISSWLGIRKRPVARLGPAEFVMALSFLWALGSILVFQQRPIPVLVDLYDRLFVPYCMYLLVRLFFPTADDLRRLLPFVFVTLMAQALIGILSWFLPSVLPAQWLGDAGERVTGTFKNPAVYTSTVLFLSLLVFQYGINSRSVKLRLLAIMTISLGLLLVAISFSRGSWLGGILFALGLIVVYPRVMIPLSLTGVLLITILGTTIFSHEVSFAFERLNDQETAQSRLLTGAKSIGMIKQKPLFGWGYGNYDNFSDEFQPQAGAANVNEAGHTSHNTYLTVMAEQGIPALALYLFPAAWWLLTSLAVFRRLPRRGFWSVTLLALLWLLILDHITVSSFMDMLRFNLFGTTIFWMALGMIAAFVAPFEQAAQPQPTRLEYYEPSPVKTIAR